MDTINGMTPPKAKNRLRFDWLLQLLIKPRRTLDAILSDPKANWQTPILSLAVVGIIEVIVAGPIKKTAIEMGTNLPPGFEYYSADQQQQFMQAQASQSSPLFLYVFPLLGLLLGILVSWFLLRSLLHLSLTLAGSRGKNILSGNLAGWSTVPLILRSLVRIIAMLLTHSTLTAKGLSGMISATTGFGNFAAAFLALIDIFFVWQVVLVLIGSEKISNLPRLKAWGVSALAIFILLVLQSLPGFLSAQMSGISLTGMFF